MIHLSWLIVALCLAVAWFVPELGGKWFRSVEDFFSRIAARRSLAVVLTFLATILLRLLLLLWIPVPVPGVHDEFSYLLQADTFAHWRLANPPHPLWVSFETLHVNWFPTYSGMFPPAQSLVLATGQLVGHPWIGVLLSCAAMAAAVVWMLQAWMPARWALLGGVITILKLGLVSYWMNSYWGGAVAAAGGALVLGGLARVLRKPHFRDALLMGLGIAILANSRPFEGLIFCLPAAVVFLVWLVKKSRVPFQGKYRRAALPVTILLVLTAAFIGYYDWRLTGNPLMMPHSWNWKQNHFTSALFLWERNGPTHEYRNTQLNVYYNIWTRSNYDGSWEALKRITEEKLDRLQQTFLWAGAFPLLLCAPLIFRDRRMRLFIVTFLLSGAALLAVIWNFPHYAAPSVCVLYALVLQSLRHVRTMRFARRPVGVGVSRVIFLLLLGTVTVDIVERVRNPYHWGWNGNMGNRERTQIVRELKDMPGKHLAIVRYGRIHNIHNEWVYNDADIDASKILWARELLDEQQNRKLLEYYRDRKVWLVQPEGGSEILKPYSPPQPPPPQQEEP